MSGSIGNFWLELSGLNFLSELWISIQRRSTAKTSQSWLKHSEYSFFSFSSFIFFLITNCNTFKIFPLEAFHMLWAVLSVGLDFGTGLVSLKINK